MIKTILIIGFLIISQFSYSQLTDKWILSYSQPIVGDTEFDLTQKQMKLRGLLVFENDSLSHISFKDSDFKTKKEPYKYESDSLYTRRDIVVQLILDKDTLRHIDTKYKESYSVLYRLAAPKKDYELNKVEEFLKSSNYSIDFSEVLVMQGREMKSLVDTLTFTDNNKLISKGNNTKSWRLLNVSGEIFLEIDKMIYVQVYLIKKDKIVFKSYFDKPHDFIMTKVK
jgi:hypothetical protein